MNPIVAGPRRSLLKTFPDLPSGSHLPHPNYVCLDRNHYSKWLLLWHGAPALPSRPFWYEVKENGYQILVTNSFLQGRAGLVAWRRSRGGVGAMGKAFYKGGFEAKMTKKEATLILSLKYVFANSAASNNALTSHSASEPLPRTRSARPTEPSCFSTIPIEAAALTLRQR